jgi:hypothetical protein
MPLWWEGWKVMNQLRGYSSPFNLGHKALQRLWDGEVIVQEKIDGSQFSFGISGLGELVCRSRKAVILLGDAGMFSLAVATAKDLYEQGLLNKGWTYRGEFLMKPKHNTLAYDRVPKGNIILFDIDRGDQHYMNMGALIDVAVHLDLECVPTYMVLGAKPSLAELQLLLADHTSILGGPMEGIVLKNYEQYGPDSKVLMAKMVSADFREKHGKDWKERNPTSKDFVRALGQEYATEARWRKAVQHLRERGAIEGAPQDIPIVMREIVGDVRADCGEEIRQALFKHFWPTIQRQLNRGAAEWYKALLAKEAMGDEDNSGS